jgi:hypothetical protein
VTAAAALVVTAMSLIVWRHPNARIPTPSEADRPTEVPAPPPGFVVLSPSDVEEAVPSPNGANDGREQFGKEPAIESRRLTSKPRAVDSRPTNYNSVPTGTRIGDDNCAGGNGELTVENGTSEDAFVRLSQSAADQTTCWFSVQAHRSETIPHIPEGIYRLTFTTGLNGVESENTFTWNPSYSEFDRTFEYREQRDSEGLQYKSISVTLNPVLNGNVRTKTITRDEFLGGHRHVAIQLHAN